VDGSSLNDISGYRILYGTSPGSLSNSVNVSGASTTSHTVTGLSPGTYYFALLTLNSSGIASDATGTVTATVQ